MKMLRHCFYLLILFSQPGLANSEYEQLLADRLKATITDGQLVELGRGPGSFIGIYRAVSEHPYGGTVVILHSMGGHPDWPQVVSPLSRRLPESGWATLAIQLPVLSPEQPFAAYGKTLVEANSRLNAALQHLETLQQQPIILLGYGFGAAQAANYLSEKKNKEIQAFICISPQAPEFLKPRMDLLQSLKKIEMPIFDIYGSRDFDAIIDQAHDRRLAGKASGGRNYYQLSIEGADYYYTGMEDILFKRVRGWLDKHIKSQ